MVPQQKFSIVFRPLLFTICWAFTLISHPPLLLRAEEGVPAQRREQQCSIASSSIKAASEIRGLSIKHDVPCYVRDKDAVRAHILSLIEEKTPPQKMKLEGLAYKALGFIPESFDYERELIELYISQLGGYYDPASDYFVMAGWIPTAFQTTIAVHELTHALQDQYFDLERFVDPKIENSDLLLARSALVEGDATAVMLDYARRLSGQGSIASEKSVESVMIQNVIGGAMVAGSGKVPQSLQLILIFPYTSGLRFAHTLLRVGGYQALDRAFKYPPRSTEEVLHPEKYGKPTPDFLEFTDEQVQGDLVGQIVHRDTLGEFAISTLLGMFLEDKQAAVRAASGWGGDKLIVLQRADKDGSNRYTVLWRSAWDTDTDAEEFFQSYSVALSRRYGGEFGSKVSLKRTGREIFASFER